MTKIGKQSQLIKLKLNREQNNKNTNTTTTTTQQQITCATSAVADPGFPEGRCQLLTRLRFVKCMCQNERIGTLGGHSPDAPPGSVNAVIPMIQPMVYCSLQSTVYKSIPGNAVGGVWAGVLGAGVAPRSQQTIGQN